MEKDGKNHQDGLKSLNFWGKFFGALEQKKWLSQNTELGEVGGVILTDQ